MDDRLLIHIGYHKTGSTYLQRLVFANEQLPFGALPRFDPQVARAICREHPYLFDPVAVRTCLTAQCAEVAAKGLVPVLSHEGLSGFAFVGGFDSQRNAERLRQVAPQARILIVIREQEQMLLSFYNQYVRHGGRERLRDFLTHPGDGRAHFHPAHLAYHHLIQHYHQIFGADRVLVLPYEMLRADPDDFVGRILAFALPPELTQQARLPEHLGRVMNPSTPWTGIVIKRQINRFLAMPDAGGLNSTPWRTINKPQNNAIKNWVYAIGSRLPDRWNKAVKDRYHATIREEIGDFYCESNRQTARICALDLASLGYRMSA